jgi:hypothetical protein
MAVNPRKGYGALGDFIGRQAPYSNADIPSLNHATPNKPTLEFGAGDVPGDQPLLNVIDALMPAQFSDKHVVAVFPKPAVYAAMNRDNPAPAGQDANAMNQADFLHWEFGDEEPYRINKAIRIQYTHTMPDGRECTAFILVGYTGESH